MSLLDLLVRELLVVATATPTNPAPGAGAAAGGVLLVYNPPDQRVPGRDSERGDEPRGQTMFRARLGSATDPPTSGTPTRSAAARESQRASEDSRSGPARSAAAAGGPELELGQCWATSDADS